MRKGRDGKKEKRKKRKKREENNDIYSGHSRHASRPPERRPTGTPHARAKNTLRQDIVPVHAILDEITTWFSLSRGQIVKISIKNSILSNFALGKVKIRPTVPKLRPSQIK